MEIFWWPTYQLTRQSMSNSAIDFQQPLCSLSTQLSHPCYVLKGGDEVLGDYKWSEQVTISLLSVSKSKRECRTHHSIFPFLLTMTGDKKWESQASVLQHEADLPSHKQSRRLTLFSFSSRSPLAALDAYPACHPVKGLVRGTVMSRSWHPKGKKRAQWQAMTLQGTVLRHQSNACRFPTSQSAHPTLRPNRNPRPGLRFLPRDMLNLQAWIAGRKVLLGKKASLAQPQPLWRQSD